MVADAGLIGAAAELGVDPGDCRSLDWRKCQRVGYTRKCEELLHEVPFGRNVQRSVAERWETTFHIRRRHCRRSASCDEL